MFDHVNWLAVIGAAVAAFVIGWLWYGPLFGKRWMELTGKRPAESAGTSMLPLVVSALMSVVAATALAVIATAFANDLVTALFVGALVWVAAVLPLKLNDLTFGGGKAGLFYIDSLYQLVSLVVMTGIVSAFRA